MCRGESGIVFLLTSFRNSIKHYCVEPCAEYQLATFNEGGKIYEATNWGFRRLNSSGLTLFVNVIIGEANGLTCTAYSGAALSETIITEFIFDLILFFQFTL